MSIVWYKILPAHFGGQQGIANFNEALGRHFTLYCVCSKNNEPGSAKHYQVFNWLPVSKLQVINPFIWWKLLRFARRHAITHVIAEHPYYGIAAWLLKIFAGCNIITHSHNIEFLRFKTSWKFGWKILRLLEGFTYLISDLVLFKTNNDASFANREWNIYFEKTLIMPFGITRKNPDKKQKSRNKIVTLHNIPSNHAILLFNGTLDYQPNADAVMHIVEDIIPALRQLNNQAFTVIITGRCLEKKYQYLNALTTDNFIMAGYVEDIASYFLAADVYINPVTDGGGVQTKTLEALSYQLPVVMFEMVSGGIEKELVNEFLLLVPNIDWALFAATANKVMKQPRNYINERFFEFYNFEENIKPLASFIRHTTQ